MAKGKGWAKKSPQDRETEPVPPAPPTLEEELKGMGAASVENNTATDNVSVVRTEVGTAAESPPPDSNPFDEALPSCESGCPHFQPVPEAGGKFLGHCRRYPPVSIARWLSQFTIINHPLKHEPPPICGEHPAFRKFA
ncbi:MAG: hypothetical protein V3W44_08505 [Dehalococcoidales bacterium]